MLKVDSTASSLKLTISENQIDNREEFAKLCKYEKLLNLHIDYNFLSTSNFILDAIEQNDEIIELIISKKENILNMTAII